MSDEGGFEELVESFDLPANCSWSCRTLASALVSLANTPTTLRSSISSRRNNSAQFGHSEPCLATPSTYPTPCQNENLC